MSVLGGWGAGGVGGLGPALTRRTYRGYSKNAFQGKLPANETVWGRGARKRRRGQWCFFSPSAPCTFACLARPCV